MDFCRNASRRRNSLFNKTDEIDKTDKISR